MYASKPETKVLPQRAARAERLAWKFEEARRLAALDPGQQELYGRLAILRARLAAEAHLPAYQILTNKQLLQLCETPPKDDAELTQKVGLSHMKLLAYGAEILATVGLKARPA